MLAPKRKNKKKKKMTTSAACSKFLHKSPQRTDLDRGRTKKEKKVTKKKHQKTGNNKKPVTKFQQHSNNKNQ
jgi:hypothetical protein